jgi:hypothetical protein
MLRVISAAIALLAAQIAPRLLRLSEETGDPRLAGTRAALLPIKARAR